MDFFLDRTPDRDCDHCDSRGDAFAYTEQGSTEKQADQLCW